LSGFVAVTYTALISFYSRTNETPGKKGHGNRPTMEVSAPQNTKLRPNEYADFEQAVMKATWAEVT